MMTRSTIIICALAAMMIGDLARAAQLPVYKVKRADIEQMARPLQDTFAGMQYLMNGHQMRQFFRLESDEARLEWIDLFWSQRDPTPTTPDNPMRVEHDVRVRLAREFFGSRKWPGWDKRGEVFVRYGPPDVRGNVPAEVTSSKVIPSREIWFYRRHYMLVSFQDFGLTGDYIYSIDPLGLSEQLSPELMEWLLYDTDHAMSGKIPLDMLEHMMAAPVGGIEDTQLLNMLTDPERSRQYELSRPREVDDRIDAPVRDVAPDALTSALMPRDLQAVFNKDEIQEVANNFEITLEETPASYPFNFEENSLPFYFGVDQFRAGPTRNRVDVTIEVPIAIENDGIADFEETFRTELVVWDPNYSEVAREHRDIVLRTGREVAMFTNLLPTQLMVSLDRGYYRMAVSVSGKNSGRESSFRTTFTCEPFDPSLSLSDIMFARKIGEATKPSIFMRGPLEVIPHPFRHYGRDFSIPIYFEIYNLALDDRGATSYSIEYKIVPHLREKKSFWNQFEETEPVVSSEFRASGFSESETLHLTINTANLTHGSYDMLITVTDGLTGTIAYRRGTFSLIE